MNKEQRRLHAYDAGLLGGYGGESVGWWHDYIRAELDRAHDHYAGQHSALLDALDAAESRATAAEARVALLEGLLREAEKAVEACGGREQPAFEAWAKQARYEMTEHPLHYLFLDEKTNAARKGWNAALAYVRSALTAKPEGHGDE